MVPTFEPKDDVKDVLRYRVKETARRPFDFFIETLPNGQNAGMEDEEMADRDIA